MFKSFCGVTSFGAILSHWPVTVKAYHRAKQIEIGDSVKAVAHLWGTCDLVVSKVTLGSFDAVFTVCAITRKGLAIERNGVEFVARKCE